MPSSLAAVLYQTRIALSRLWNVEEKFLTPVSASPTASRLWNVEERFLTSFSASPAAYRLWNAEEKFLTSVSASPTAQKASIFGWKDSDASAVRLRRRRGALSRKLDLSAQVGAGVVDPL